MVKKLLAALAAMFALSACATPLSTHPTVPAEIGAPVSTSHMLEALKQPGSIAFEQVIAADWRWSEDFATPGVDPPDWQSAELQGQVYFYNLRHPTRGLILIDTGLPADTPRYLGAVVRNVFDIDNTFTARLSTAEALGGVQPSAVLLTHLHWDHVLGARDLPREVPLYVGPGDGAQRNFLLRFIAPATRRALEGRGPLHEWRFSADPDARTAGVIDVFGDGSIFAIRAPGHTPGSTAYIVNAIDGAHLITGDAIHSAAGWRGERVEYITFDPDRPRAWETLAQLQALARAIPGIIVHPGHQVLKAIPAASPWSRYRGRQCAFSNCRAAALRAESRRAGRAKGMRCCRGRCQRRGGAGRVGQWRTPRPAQAPSTQARVLARRGA